MCEERKWKKDIHIQLANMKYTDSCIEILQNSDLGRAYFSDYECSGTRKHICCIG